MEYNNYLKTGHWRHLRNNFKNKNKRRCFICRSKEKLDVHHKRYYLNGESILFKERDRDLRVLCRRCHDFIHKNGLTNLLALGAIKRTLFRDYIMGEVKIEFDSAEDLTNKLIRLNIDRKIDNINRFDQYLPFVLPIKRQKIETEGVKRRKAIK